MFYTRVCIKQNKPVPKHKMPGKSWKRGTPEKNYYIGIAANLLYSSASQPCWSGLPKPVKRELCKLIHTSYQNIHDPKFYLELDAIWARNNTVQDPNAMAMDVETIDCAICIDTYNLDGKDKVTTLMCGHHFCTSCIFRHIQSSRGPTCPMCRRCVFTDHLEEHRQHQERVSEYENRMAQEKRTRRKMERWGKHQKKKQERLNQKPIITTTTS